QPSFRAGVSCADRTRSPGREIYSIVSADAGVHQPHLRPAGLPAPALHSRGQELPDDQLRMHRRTASLGNDRRRCQQAAAKSGIQSEGCASRQSEVGNHCRIEPCMAISTVAGAKSAETPAKPRPIARLLRYVLPYWWQFLVSVALMALVGLFDAGRVLLIGPN